MSEIPISFKGKTYTMQDVANTSSVDDDDETPMYFSPVKTDWPPVGGYIVVIPKYAGTLRAGVYFVEDIGEGGKAVIVRDATTQSRLMVDGVRADVRLFNKLHVINDPGDIIKLHHSPENAFRYYSMLLEEALISLNPPMRTLAIFNDLLRKGVEARGGDRRRRTSSFTALFPHKA